MNAIVPIADEKALLRARADHFEAALRGFLGRAKQGKPIWADQMLREISIILTASPGDYLNLPAWGPEQPGMRNGEPVLVQTAKSPHPVVAVYNPGGQRAAAAWWVGSQIVEPIAFCRVPPFDWTRP